MTFSSSLRNLHRRRYRCTRLAFRAFRCSAYDCETAWLGVWVRRKMGYGYLKVERRQIHMFFQDPIEDGPLNHFVRMDVSNCLGMTV